MGKTEGLQAVLLGDEQAPMSYRRKTPPEGVAFAGSDKLKASVLAGLRTTYMKVERSTVLTSLDRVYLHRESNMKLLRGEIDKEEYSENKLGLPWSLMIMADLAHKRISLDAAVDLIDVVQPGSEIPDIYETLFRYRVSGLRKICAQSIKGNGADAYQNVFMDIAIANRKSEPARSIDLRSCHDTLSDLHKTTTSANRSLIAREAEKCIEEYIDINQKKIGHQTFLMNNSFDRSLLSSRITIPGHDLEGEIKYLQSALSA